MLSRLRKLFAILSFASAYASESSTETHELQGRQNGGGPPLIVRNGCGETIYPGILTQSGTGPGTGGFELSPGSQRTLSVSENWQGRVWGRTNCSFSNGGGTSGPACSTGDCGGVSCQGAGEGPVSLAEFTLDSGSGQTFYDISLVDGYNLPLAIVMQPLGNGSFTSVPQNLTNPSCVGTAGDLAASPFNPYGGGQTFLGTNSSTPLPFESKNTANQVASWCPSNLEVTPLDGPRNGVYMYPDGNVQRPAFDPCFSACAKNHQPQDCCTGSYDSPSACKPSGYSAAAKGVCPDAYSYAFDDQTSTFIIPAGAGFEVVFCPGGRSTNILATEKPALTQLSQTGHTKRDYTAGNVLDLEAPDISTIPLAVLSNMEKSHPAVSASLTTTSSNNADADARFARLKADAVRQSAAQASTLNMWSLRHRWNGSGTLIGPDLTRQKRHYISVLKRAEPPVVFVRSDAHRQGHFVRQERVRSAFCLGLGMLVGAVGAWAVL